MALWLAASLPGYTADACDLTPDGTTQTCTGDQESGVGVQYDVTDVDRITTLNVNSLDRDIGPEIEVDGIHFDTPGDAHLVSNTGEHKIAVWGTGADGIFVSSWNGDYSASVDHTGDIESESGYGIYVTAEGEVTSTSVGDINAGGGALRAKSVYDAVTLTHTGNLTSADGFGVEVEGQGVVSVTTNGAIDSQEDGIFAKSYGSNTSTTVSHTGTISSSNGSGINAISEGSSVTITVNGRIETLDAGIVARSGNGWGGSTVTVTHSGGILSSEGRGIDAEASSGAVLVTTGDATGVSITSRQDGIRAVSGGTSGGATVTVLHNGNISALAETDDDAAQAHGVYAYASGAAVSVTTIGNIEAETDGIHAESHGGSAGTTVLHTGTITTNDGRGVYADAASGPVSVTVNGSVSAKTDGIYADSRGGGVTVLVDDVTAWEGVGIYAKAANGAASVTVDGTVEAKLDGIYAETESGSGSVGTTIISDGVTSWEARGIYAKAANGPVSVTVEGAVEAKTGGIYAESTGGGYSGSVTINADDVTSWDARAIEARSANGAVSITTAGEILAKTDGIYAFGSGSDSRSTVTIDHTGDITAYDGYGIYAETTLTKVSVATEGDIEAGSDGIHAETTSATDIVDINHVGNVVSWQGVGIYASTANTTAKITTDGNITGETYGIAAHTLGTGADITITSGTVTSRTEDAAIHLATIDGSTITNYGTIDGGHGYAVEAVTSSDVPIEVDGGYGTNTITNYGTINGSFSLFGGAGEIFNTETGTLNTGEEVSFYSGAGTLRNAGVLSPGGFGTVLSTSLDGDFVQTGTGRFLVDLDVVNGVADQLAVTGSADLGGMLTLNLLEFNGTLPSSFTVVTSSDLISTGFTLGNIALDASIDYVDDTNVVVTLNGFDFGSGGSTGSGGVSEGLNAAFRTGSAALNPVFNGLLNIDNAEEYDDAVKQLAPEIGSESTSNTVNSNLEFANRLLSCRVRDGVYAFNAEGECVWTSMAATWIDREATSENTGYHQTSYKVAGGAQRAIADDWRLGFALGYTNSSADTDLGASSEGDQFEAGLVLKYDHEALTLATSLTSGYGWYNNSRSVDFGGFADELTGENGIGFVSGRLRAAYTIATGPVYVRPMTDFDLTWLAFGGYTEDGGPSALTYQDSDHTVFTATPALEFGGEFKASDGIFFRPYFSAGVSFLSGADVELAAHFAAVDASAGTFAIRSNTDDMLGKVTAGLDILTPRADVIRFYYEGSYGETIEQHTAGAKFAFPF